MNLFLEGLIGRGLERAEEEERGRMVEEGRVERDECHEFHRLRYELIDGLTTHAFNMVDFMLAAKDFSKRLALCKSVFYYPNTRLEVFFERKKDKRKKCKIHLKGFKGASWFDYQIQLAWFLREDTNIIEISIIHNYYKMVVVFLPRTSFKPRGRRRYKCPLLTVDTKTGNKTWGTNSFNPSTYNPLIEEDLF